MVSMYRKERSENLRKYITFLSERFGLFSSPLMISLFVLSHLGLVYQHKEDLPPLHLILSIFLGVILFFVKLRFYDEIKDYELDKVINPTRPLPRGLLSTDNVKGAIEKVILIELLLFYGVNLPAFVAMSFTIAYSLLMYKEFFIGRYIRHHLTTYATSHTVVTLFLSISIFSAFSDRYFWNLDTEYYFFALTSWLIFNIFELGRKIYQPCEEREGVESYSGVWGRPGAVMLVLAHVSLVYYLSNKIDSFHYKFPFSPLIIPVAMIGFTSILYLASKKKIFGKMYRTVSSVYILISYIIYLCLLGYKLYPTL